MSTYCSIQLSRKNDYLIIYLFHKTLLQITEISLEFHVHTL